MKGNKTERIEFLVTPALKAAIENASSTEGMGKSVWLRKTILKVLNPKDANLIERGTRRALSLPDDFLTSAQAKQNEEG